MTLCLNKTQQHTFILYLKKILPFVISCGFNKKILIITVKSKDVLFLLHFLKLHYNTNFNCLTAISCVDYPFRKKRFEVIYELLSLSYNNRLRVKTFIDEITTLESSVTVFSAATWWEREIWDLFGVYFENNHEMKRLLTDYGFEGHPLRKDFPLSGYVEARYCDQLKRVVCEPLEHAQEYRAFEFTTNWSALVF